MSDKKDGRIGGRLPAGLRERLDAIVKTYGPMDSTMLEDALTALADYVERNKAYRRPMRMIYDGAEARDESARWQLNEDGPGGFAELQRDVDAMAKRVREAAATRRENPHP